MHNLPPPYTDVLYYYIAVWLCVPRTLYTCFIDCVCASSIILFPTSFFLFLRSWMCLHFFVCSPASGITNYTPCTAKLCRDWNFLSIIRSIIDWLKNRFFVFLLALFFITDFCSSWETWAFTAIGFPSRILLYCTSLLYKFRSPCERQQIFVKRLHASSYKEIRREENAKLSSNSTWHI